MDIPSFNRSFWHEYWLYIKFKNFKIINKLKSFNKIQLTFIIKDYKLQLELIYLELLPNVLVQA
jgi:hypothetical protein